MAKAIKCLQHFCAVDRAGCCKLRGKQGVGITKYLFDRLAVRRRIRNVCRPVHDVVLKQRLLVIEVFAPLEQPIIRVKFKSVGILPTLCDRREISILGDWIEIEKSLRINIRNLRSAGITTIRLANYGVASLVYRELNVVLARRCYGV